MVFTLDVVADVGAPDELLVVPSMMDCWREEVRSVWWLQSSRPATERFRPLGKKIVRSIM